MKFKTLVLESLDELMTQFKLFKLLLFDKIVFLLGSFFQYSFLVMILVAIYFLFGKTIALHKLFN